MSLIDHYEYEHENAAPQQAEYDPADYEGLSIEDFYEKCAIDLPRNFLGKVIRRELRDSNVPTSPEIVEVQS